MERKGADGDCDGLALGASDGEASCWERAAVGDAGRQQRWPFAVQMVKY